MVERPQKIKIFFGAFKQEKAHQRRFGKVEALLFVVRKKLFEFFRLFRFRKRRPVFFGNGQFHIFVHHLQHFIQFFIDKGGTQSRMTAHHFAPGFGKGVAVKRAAQPAGKLFKIGARLRIVNGMKQHPLLHRRQGIDGFDIFIFCIGHRGVSSLVFL